MPSTRSQPLNPLVAGLPPAPVAPALPMARVPRRAVAVPALPAAPAEPDPVEALAEVARAGGFHESSYELKSGLEVSESEWPDDTTVPAKLGER